MIDIDKVLRKALSPTECPSDELNEEIFCRMDMKKTEGEKLHMTKKKYIAAAVVLICLLVVPVSVYAAYKYLLPKEAAREMDDSKLGQAFEEKGKDVLQTVTDGSYKVTYLGHVTGETISDRTGSSWDLHPDRLYVAVAVEKADGSDMSYDDDIFVSPLIQGLAPWKYNIATMNGSYMADIIDGVMYRIIECDNIEVFADRKLYLAVSNTRFFSNEAYNFDEVTGEITVNEAFEKTNVLFDMELDSSKANPVKAKEYLDQLEKEWNSGSESDEKESSLPDDNDTGTLKMENTRVQQEYFDDEENGITIHIKDNDSHCWSAGLEYSHTILQYYLEVIWDNIETLTFTLNKGEFCSFPEHSISEAEHYGNECSIAYDEQKNRNFLYSIYFKGVYEDYGYDPEEVQKLAETDPDARSKVYFDALNKAVSDTKMELKIKMKDGREIIKNLTFRNVSDTERSFRIAIDVEQ